MGKNRRNTTTKEQILKKVRHALLEKKEHPFPQFEDSPLYRQPESDSLAVLFAEQFTSGLGKFVYCEDEIELAEQLLDYIERTKLRNIYAWERPIQALLSHFEFPFISTEYGFEDVEVGITGCEALVARKGAILVSSRSTSGRRLSIYPPIHIVLARTSQLVLDIEDAVTLMKQTYEGVFPSSFSFITGPSQTADIEKTLVKGAHGPKELIVFLIEN